MILEWRNSILIISFLFCSLMTTGQVSGYVYNFDSDLPLKSCNIFDESSKKGTITDVNGRFSIQSTVGSILTISFVGYNALDYVVEKKDVGKIYLHPLLAQIQEVKVIMKEDPGVAIMRKVIRRNKRSNHQRIISNRTELLKICLTETGNTINPLNKSALFQYYTDSLEKGVPFYISMQNYKKDNIINDTSYGVGLKKDYFKDYINSINIDFDIQRNTVNLFGRGIVSPISQDALSFYKYYLLDSLFVNNEYCYKIKVVSKRESDVAFNGMLWVNTDSYQTQKTNLSLNSNFINYAKNISLIQEFNDQDSNRYQSRNSIQFSFSLTNLYVLDSLSLLVEKDIYWETDLQHIENKSNFTKKKAILNKEAIIIQSLNDDSHIKLVTKLSEMFISSYYTIGMIDIGPIYHMHSHNKMEGQRVSLMMRTNKKLFNNALISGYIGKGFADKRNKFGFQFKIRTKKNNSLVLCIGAKSDIEYLGSSFINNSLYPNRFNNSSENIFSSIFKRSNQDEMVYFHTNKITLTKEFSNFDISLYYFQKVIEKNEDLLLNYTLSQSSFGMNMNFSLSKKIKNHFDIINVKSHLPIFFANLHVVNNPYNSKSVVNAKFAALHTFNTSMFGRTKYLLDLGIVRNNDSHSIFDLELHRGNRSYIYDFTKSSLMNKYEFISDRYAAIYLEHHLNGRILNRIPFLKRLELREMLVSNIIFGNIHDKSALDNLPNFTTPLSYDNPYIELGIGLENIFKVIRINMIWRLSHLENNDTPYFGISGGMCFAL